MRPPTELERWAMFGIGAAAARLYIWMMTRPSPPHGLTTRDRAYRHRYGADNSKEN